MLRWREDLSTSYDERLLKCYDLELKLVKSHEDDLVLEYLWNGDEYGSLENSLKAMEKNAEYAGQPEILALVHVIESPIHCSL